MENHARKSFDRAKHDKLAYHMTPTQTLRWSMRVIRVMKIDNRKSLISGNVESPFSHCQQHSQFTRDSAIMIAPKVHPCSWYKRNVIPHARGKLYFRVSFAFSGRCRWEAFSEPSLRSLHFRELLLWRFAPSSSSTSTTPIPHFNKTNSISSFPLRQPRECFAALCAVRSQIHIL